jgi:hypothetical protein
MLSTLYDGDSVRSDASFISQLSEASTLLPTYDLSAQPAPKMRWACTRCNETCGRKDDWIRHEKYMHERWQTWCCQSCSRNYYSETRFIRHHEESHECQPCTHARDAVVSNKKPRFWTCGFCSSLFQSFDERCDHIAEHYINGKTKADWDNTKVIFALLQNTEWAQSWVSFVERLHGSTIKSWPEFHWDQEATVDLLKLLECGDYDSNPMEVMSLAYKQGLPSHMATMHCTIPEAESVNMDMGYMSEATSYEFGIFIDETLITDIPQKLLSKSTLSTAKRTSETGFLATSSAPLSTTYSNIARLDARPFDARSAQTQYDSGLTIPVFAKDQAVRFHPRSSRIRQAKSKHTPKTRKRPIQSHSSSSPESEIEVSFKRLKGALSIRGGRN